MSKNKGRMIICILILILVITVVYAQKEDFASMFASANKAAFVL